MNLTLHPLPNPPPFLKFLSPLKLRFKSNFDDQEFSLVFFLSENPIKFSVHWQLQLKKRFFLNFLIFSFFI